jgi:hypothetical protein
MAFVSKSVTITYLPLAEELARRGHQGQILKIFSQKKCCFRVKLLLFRKKKGL